MTALSDAERVAMWPAVPDSRCGWCGDRGVCVWSTCPPRLLCASWCHGELLLRIHERSEE